jgi:hypothetical protein
VLLAPGRGLLLFACLWKAGTELLFPWAGDSVWEFIERGGSYGAPLALMMITRARPLSSRAEPLEPSPATV